MVGEVLRVGGGDGDIKKKACKEPSDHQTLGNESYLDTTGLWVVKEKEKMSEGETKKSV